jgi:hypothetical protein
MNESNAMSPWKTIYEAVIADTRYQKNLDWGQSRPGHPEGTLRAHVAELEQNLERMKQKVCESEYWQLEILIHTHDSFKADAKRGAAICDPDSHASLARAFLQSFCADSVLLDIVQYHDEPFALWNQYRSKGRYATERMVRLLNLDNWDLFIAFNIIDGCTAGKDRTPLKWFIEETNGKRPCRWTADDILPS